jgi:hypothetical protein
VGLSEKAVGEVFQRLSTIPLLVWGCVTQTGIAAVIALDWGSTSASATV